MTDFRPDQTPVRNQGNRPTCVAFAVSAGHEWSAGDGIVRATEDAMWAAHEVDGIPGREEVTVGWALSGLDAHHHATEHAWPYGQPHWSDGRPDSARECANQRALPNWTVLSDSGFDTIAGALATGTPVILTIRVVRVAWRDPTGLIDAEPNRKTPGNHAVLAVGILTGPDRIIIKNSWGPHWGDHGYGYLTRRYIEHYALRAHTLTTS